MIDVEVVKNRDKDATIYQAVSRYLKEVEGGYHGARIQILVPGFDKVHNDSELSLPCRQTAKKASGTMTSVEGKKTTMQTGNASGSKDWVAGVSLPSDQFVDAVYRKTCVKSRNKNQVIFWTCVVSLSRLHPSVSSKSQKGLNMTL